MDVLGWEKIIALPAALIVLIVILYFIFKALPTWKEVKLAEIKVREVEAAARTHEAGIFGQVGETLNSLSGLIKDVVIDQRRDTKNIELMQRVNSDAADKILEKLDALENAAQGIEENRKRLDVIEARLDCDDKNDSERKNN